MIIKYLNGQQQQLKFDKAKPEKLICKSYQLDNLYLSNFKLKLKFNANLFKQNLATEKVGKLVMQPNFQESKDTGAEAVLKLIETF